MRDGGKVRIGEIPFRQVRDHQLPARGEDLLGNLAARVEADAAERHVSAHARELRLELAALVGQHDEATLGAGQVDGRVHHEREHFVEHTAAAQAAQRLEQRRNLAEPADDARRAAPGARVRRLVVEQEQQLGAGRPANLDPVAVRQPLLGDLRAVHVGAAARPAIADQVLAVAPQDLGVVPGDVGAGQLQVVRRPPSDGERRLVERNDPPTLRVGDFEPRICHGVRGL